MKTIFSKPENLFSLFALTPFLIAPFIAVEIPRALTYLPLLMILFALPLVKGSYRKEIRAFKNYLVLMVACLCLMLLHCVFIGHYDESHERFSKLILLFSGGSSLLILSRHIVPDKFPKYLNILIFSCAAASLLAFIEMYFEGPLYNFLRPNATEAYFIAVFNRSAVSICFLLLTSFFLLEKKNYTHFLALFATLPMLFITFSQSAQLLMVFTLSFYFLFPSRYKAAWALTLFGIGLVMFLKPFLVPYIYNDLPSLRDSNYFLQYAAAGPRLEIWDYISRKIYDHPFLGHGLEFTRTYDNFDTQARYHDHTSVMHPHSYILQLWIEFGVVGVTVAFAMISTLMMYIYRKLNGHLRKAALSVFISFLFISEVSHGLWQSWWVSLAFMLSSLIVMAVSYKKHYNN